MLESTKWVSDRPAVCDLPASCGGTSYVWVLRSIFSYTSMQGMTKKTPGPLALPVSILPSLNTTARSYSWTTFTTQNRDMGKVRQIRRREMKVKA